MAVSEQRRMQLFERLAATIGEEATTTVFELLPPPGAEPATRDDIESLREDIRRGFAHVDRRFADVDQRFGDLEERLTDRLSSLWRRDLLMVSGAQFFALAAAVAALVQLG